MNTITPLEALQACLDKAGTQPKLAEGLGCTQQAVSKMFQSAKRMSLQYVLVAESLYGVSRYDLRPDIYKRTAPMMAAMHGQPYFAAGRRAAS